MLAIKACKSRSILNNPAFIYSTSKDQPSLFDKRKIPSVCCSDIQLPLYPVVNLFNRKMETDVETNVTVRTSDSPLSISIYDHATRPGLIPIESVINIPLNKKIQLIILCFDFSVIFINHNIKNDITYIQFRCSINLNAFARKARKHSGTRKYLDT